MKLVEAKYGNVEKEKNNISDYLSLNHESNIYEKKQAKKIL